MKKKSHECAISGIGIDLVEVERFRTLLRGRKEQFLLNTFSEKERTYCTSFKDSAPHFAGTFAAKEAAQKALGVFTMRPNVLEVRRMKSGKPEIWLNGKPEYSLLVSITHSKSNACAIVLKHTV